MNIKYATDWQTISVGLRKQMSSIGYNPDLQKMYQNIERMVSELSKLEVECRRMNNYSKIEDKIQAINGSISHLEKLLLMAQLMR